MTDWPLIISVALVTLIAAVGVVRLFLAAKKQEPDALRKLTLATLRQYEAEVVRLETEAKAATAAATEARRAYESTRANIGSASTPTASAAG
jgi:uncharacterized protein YlxW (UPF0749 family)